MRFDKHDLWQLDPEYINKLPNQRVCDLFEQMRTDLLEAHDKLDENPSNP